MSWTGILSESMRVIIFSVYPETAFFCDPFLLGDRSASMDTWRKAQGVRRKAQGKDHQFHQLGPCATVTDIPPDNCQL